MSLATIAGAARLTLRLAGAGLRHRPRPRTIAETARAIYDGFKSVFAWPFGAPAYQK